jgi:LAS superfamily LD-carboxypeptidase LdcB
LIFESLETGKILLKFLKFFMPVTLIMLSASLLHSDETGIYRIPVFDYVTGRFNPSQHSLFVNLDDTSISAARKNMYLRKEAAEAFKIMMSNFRRDNPGIKVWIQSATRNFEAQKNIWDRKWTGRLRVIGTSDITEITDPLERAQLILRYSSMPGTSRHHWGTDFDINYLNNSYYENGEGAVIYRWFVKNARAYGFGQPYTSGRDSGYEEEKWHWSYLPLAKQFLQSWNTLYISDPSAFNRKNMFQGSEKAGHLAPVYVNFISRECK